jgi:hypothetical protein
VIAHWLGELSVASLAVGGACAVSIALDLVRRPQQMRVMNVVWPVPPCLGPPSFYRPPLAAIRIT